MSMRRARFHLPRALSAVALVVSILAFYNTVVSVAFDLGAGDVREDPSLARRDEITAMNDRVEIAFQVTEIDTIRESVIVDYTAVPYGAYGSWQRQSAYIREPFTLQVGSSGSGRAISDPLGSEAVYAPDTYVGGFQAPLDIYPCDALGAPFDPEGGSLQYPYDRYCFDTVVRTFAAPEIAADGTKTYGDPPPAWLNHQGSGIDGYRISLSRVPFYLDTERGECYEWALAADQPCSTVEDATGGYSRIIGMIERSPVVIIFTWVVLGMIVLGAICAVAVTLAIARRTRNPSLDGLAFLAALLFAVQPLRNALPDAPPVGIDFDVRIFYPCVLTVLFCLAAQVLMWIYREDAES